MLACTTTFVAVGLCLWKANAYSADLRNFYSFHLVLQRSFELAYEQGFDVLGSVGFKGSDRVSG